jgi:hypothetical protein
MAPKKKAASSKAPSIVAQPAPVVPVPAELWKDEPDDHDYPAAQNYLSLCVDAKKAEHLTDLLRQASIETFKAKDLLRSARLDLLPLDDPSVKRDLAKVVRGQRLSPVLVVRGHALEGVPSIVADGYHRICASYHLSEDEDIPCRIIDGDA